VSVQNVASSPSVSRTPAPRRPPVPDIERKDVGPTARIKPTDRRGRHRAHDDLPGVVVDRRHHGGSAPTRRPTTTSGSIDRRSSSTTASSSCCGVDRENTRATQQDPVARRHYWLRRAVPPRKPHPQAHQLMVFLRPVVMLDQGPAANKIASPYAFIRGQQLGLAAAAEHDHAHQRIPGLPPLRPTRLTKRACRAVGDTAQPAPPTMEPSRTLGAAGKGAASAPDHARQ